MKRTAALLAVLFAATACSKLEDPTGVPLQDIIRLDFTGPSSIRADGVSMTTVEATIPAEATNRNVKFTTTHGTFQNTGGKAEVTVTADAQGKASATIIAGREVVTSSVTASIGTFVTSLTLPHERAYAQSLTVETNAANVNRAGTRNATITAILTRQSGFVSNGTRVTFEASAGRIFNVNATDINGKATATYTADTLTAPTDNVIITVTTQSDAGGNLSAQLTVKVE